MLYLYYVDAPDIDEGSFVPRPSVITEGNKRVKIGTPVYVYNGYQVTIDCYIVGGTHPINITWFHNGSPDPTGGSVSNNISTSDIQDGDVFKCKAQNIEGSDTESTTIYIEYRKYHNVATYEMHIYY